MKKYLIVTFVIALLILDLLALDDITSGNESNLTGEYIFHALVSVVIGYFIISKSCGYLYNLQRKIIKSNLSINYHIHHDFIGLVLIFFALFLSPFWLQITISGVGVGLILHHAITDGFKFITKY